MKEYEKSINAFVDNVRGRAYSMYELGYEDGKAATHFTDTKEAERKAYNRGLNDAWEVIKKITKDDSVGGYSIEMMQELFGRTCVYDITHNYTPEEAIAKIREYEDKQKQDAEIKVGDEVYSEEDDLRFVVTRITNGRYEGICTDGACYCPLPLHIKKTGRHAYRIIELLGELDETD